MPPRCTRQRSLLKRDLLVIICRPENRAPILSRTDNRHRMKVNRHRHHEPTRIVGMLSDQVHSCRSSKHPPHPPKALPMHTQRLYPIHLHPQHLRCWNCKTTSSYNPATLFALTALTRPGLLHPPNLAPRKQIRSHTVRIARRRLERRRFSSSLLNTSQPAIRINMLQHPRPRLRNHWPIDLLIQNPL